MARKAQRKTSTKGRRQAKRVRASRPSAPGFAERLRTALVGISSEEVARALGVSRTSFYRWLGGRFEPGMAKLAALASIANVSLDWLIAGRGEMRPAAVPGYVKPHSPIAPQPLAFERRWCAANIFRVPLSEIIPASSEGVDLDSFIASGIILTEIQDDAMEPTLNKGDLVLARRVTLARANGIYLLCRTSLEAGEKQVGSFVVDSAGELVNRLFVRRLEWSEGGRALVKCDNQAYPGTIELTDHTEDMVLAGPVIWYGRFI
jgi:transcriptional regulator with XRE-family HTH domain